MKKIEKMSDWEECEMWIKELLSPKEREAINDDRWSPHWELNPPQREECDSSYTYAVMMKEYAERVLNKSKS